MGVHVWVDIEAPSSEVWRHAADLASHTEWMRDAASIEFLSDSSSGVGTTMRVLTKVGPLRTHDVMEVVRWEAPRLIEVRHQGIVTGMGRFEIEPLDAERTRFSWIEELEMPWFFGGKLGLPVSERVLEQIWKANLRGFKRLVEADQRP